MKYFRIFLRACSFLAFAMPNAFAVEPHEPFSEFERRLYSGHNILTEEEQASLLAAVTAHMPDLIQNARIAGTRGKMSAGTISGYYGTVFFGPITQDGQNPEYWSMTIWGDKDRWWRFDHERRYRIIELGGEPDWVWLEEPVTQDQAEEVLGALAQLLDESQTNESVESFSQSEISEIHRFRRSRYQRPDVIYSDQPRPVPWYAEYDIIEAYSQPANGWLNDSMAQARFAATESGMKLISLYRNINGKWAEIE